MISNIVYDAFNSAQNLIYAGVRDGQVADQEKDTQELKEIPFQVAFVASLLDGFLEVLKPLAISIESLAMAAFSALKGLFSLMKGDTEEARRGFRLAVFNMNKAIENGVYFVIVAALSPLFIIAQTFMLMKDKESAQSMRVQFESPVKKEEASFDRDEDGLYEDVQEFAKEHFHSPKSSKKIDHEIEHKNRNSAEHDEDGEEEMEMLSFAEHSKTRSAQFNKVEALEPGIVSRLATATPLAFADAFLSIYRPAIMSIGTLIDGVVFGILKLVGTQELSDFRSIFKELNLTARSLAQVAAKAVMSPMTLLGQFFSIFRDPDYARPSRINLYSPHAGDEVQLLHGKAKIARTISDDDDERIYALERVAKKGEDTEFDSSFGYALKNSNFEFVRNDAAVYELA